eukprot:954517_1
MESTTNDFLITTSTDPQQHDITRKNTRNSRLADNKDRKRDCEDEHNGPTFHMEENTRTSYIHRAKRKYKDLVDSSCGILDDSEQPKKKAKVNNVDVIAVISLDDRDVGRKSVENTVVLDNNMACLDDVNGNVDTESLNPNDSNQELNAKYEKKIQEGEAILAEIDKETDEFIAALDASERREKQQMQCDMGACKRPLNECGDVQFRDQWNQIDNKHQRSGYVTGENASNTPLKSNSSVHPTSMLLIAHPLLSNNGLLHYIYVLLHRLNWKLWLMHVNQIN